MSRRISLVLALLLAGCTHSAAVSVSPAVNVYSGYADLVPGKYALFIDDRVFDARADKAAFECSGHKYPIDARVAFRESAIQTASNVFESVEVVDEPLKGSRLSERGFSGIVVLEGTLFQPKLDVDANFWSADAEASVEVGVLAEVFSLEKRLLTSRVGATGRGEKNVGAFCSGGGKALSKAAEAGIREALERTAERIANSGELRP